MNAPIVVGDHAPLAVRYAVLACQGLSPAIDAVAECGAASHRFLRRGWFAAAIQAYGGRARTWVVERSGIPVIALPTASVGPDKLGMVMVAGSFWPYRSFPVADDAESGAFDALLNAVARTVRVLRFGPVYDGDPALEGLRAAAERQGWRAVPRFVAESFVLDMAALRAEGTWPRNSTLRKNRFHEKHLSEHGALDWRFVTGADWSDAAFDALSDIERGSWIGDRTDGSDAKFASDAHGRFWRQAAADPVIADAMWAAVLSVDGKPAAFSFDLNAGDLKYAIANSYLPVFGKHSPGKLLYYRNLIRAIDDGITHVDWGAGDSGYKRTIGAEDGPAIRDWLFVRPGIASSAAAAFGWAWTRSGNGFPR